MEELVIDHRCLLGEGPVWDMNLQSICWVDILRGEIHEFSPANDLHKTISVKQMIGAIAICKNGHFIAALKNGFGAVSTTTSKAAAMPCLLSAQNIAGFPRLSQQR